MISSLLENFSMFLVIFTLASIAGMISERAGVVNVGIEGFMIIGGLVTALVGADCYSSMGNISQILALLGAACAGATISLLHAFASIKLKADQIISGTAINLLAQGIGLYVATTGKTYIYAEYTPISFESKNFLTFYFLIAILITSITGLYFTFTKTGMRHISAGENPNALDAAGVNVIKYRYVAVIVSGAIASVAGGIFTITVKGSFFYGTADGYGFLALAIMIVGQWRVKYIALGASLFSLFFTISKLIPLYGGIKDTYRDLFLVLPFVLSLLTMIVLSKWSKVPKAIGKPFEKSKR